jgi:hypothetical protein
MGRQYHKFRYVPSGISPISDNQSSNDLAIIRLIRQYQILYSIQVFITEKEKTYSIDLRPFMNPSPYTLQCSASLPRMFRLFRALGLRHLPIVNDTNEVGP